MNVCYEITTNNIGEDIELKSNQEEADTKIIFHACVIIKRYPNKKIIIRNHSGDIDIIVITLGVIFEDLEQIYFDTNKGNYRKLYKLSDVSLSKNEKSALLGFHAFTGNDYVSSFFKKGKISCWRILEKHPQFLKTFAELGESHRLSESIMFDSLEEFVCLMYGSTCHKKVNSLRLQMFQTKYEKNNTIIDLSLLPPCRNVLELHILRATYVANIWRHSNVGYQPVHVIEKNGWSSMGNIERIKSEKAFPEDVLSLLVTENVDDVDFSSVGEDSEDENEVEEYGLLENLED